MGALGTPRRREWAMGAGALALGLLLAALLGEAYVRAVWGSLMPMRVIKTYVQRGDARLGVVNRPGASFTLRSKALGEVVFEANARGLRERKEIPYEKPAGERRLLALGDSFTYGQWVNEPDAFPARIEAALPGWEVLNAGVMGWGVDQELLWLRSEGLRYAPDVVAAFFYVQNDFAGPDDLEKVRFALEDGRLAERPAGKANRRERNPALAALVDEFDLPWFLVLKWNELRHTALARAEPPNEMLAVHRRTFPDARERPGFALTLAMLREMRRASEATGARFLLATIDSHSVQPALWRAMLAHPRVHAEDYDPRRPEGLLEDFAAAEGIAFLSLGDMARARAQEPLFLADDPHFSAPGHRRAAEAVVLKLKELGWTD